MLRLTTPINLDRFNNPHSATSPPDTGTINSNITTPPMTVLCSTQRQCNGDLWIGILMFYFFFGYHLLSIIFIYINGLPPHFLEDRLFTLTSPFGEIRSVRTFTRHVRDSENGYGFVL